MAEEVGRWHLYDRLELPANRLKRLGLALASARRLSTEEQDLYASFSTDAMNRTTKSTAAVRDLTHYVVVYDRLTGRVRITPFSGDGAAEGAMRARLDAESNAGPDQEVTTLTAASEDDLRATHARYFQSPSEMVDGFERLLAD